MKHSVRLIEAGKDWKTLNGDSWLMFVEKYNKKLQNVFKKLK